MVVRLLLRSVFWGSIKEVAERGEGEEYCDERINEPFLVIDIY